MATIPLPPPDQTSLHNSLDSLDLKQQRELMLKVKESRYLTKKPARPVVCKATKVNKVVSFSSSLPKEVEENSLQIVPCFVYKNSSALQQAHEVQDNLGQEFPSFVKVMLRSHVTGGFSLGLPRPFCLENLPKHDETVVLVGKNDEEYNTKYLAGRNGLSGGWRGFSISHNLLEGDVLVFQLIKECKFKVYIVRASGLTENDGPISQLNLPVDPKPIVPIVVLEDDEEEKVEEESICEALVPENAESLSSCTDQAYSQGNENSENSFSDILEEIGYLEPAVDFKDVKTFEAFSILVDGLPVCSNVDEHTRRKYYELCRGQQCYLHEHLIAGLNLKLVAGIILETVNIADAIRAAKLVTPLAYLETWDNTLKSFEDLGMTVGFLREMLKRLKNISYEQKKKVETKKRERDSLEEEIRSLRLKVLDAERALRSVDDELEALKVEDKKLEVTFKEVASAPW